MDLSTTIGEVGNIHEVVITELAKLNTSRATFALSHNIDPTELVGREATPVETLPDNGDATPLLNQPPSKYSPLVDALDATDSPLPLFCKYSSASACLYL